MSEQPSEQDVFELAAQAADKHIDAASLALSYVHHIRDNDSANLATVSIAHSLLALAVMFRHVFGEDFADAE